MATILYPDGTSKEVSPKNSRNFKLKELQEIVGGDIEVIPTKDEEIIMVINEEGKLLDLPRNDQATLLVPFPTPQEQQAMARQPGVIFVGDPHVADYVAGIALICKDEEVQ